MCINVEKNIAKLRRQLKKAIARVTRVTEIYRVAVSKLYLYTWKISPKFVPFIVDNERQFVTEKFRIEDLYIKTFDSGFGHTEYRSISRREWEHLSNLENAILDAWDKHHEIHWELTDLLRRNPQIINPLPPTVYDDKPELWNRIYPYDDEDLLA